MIDRRYEQRDPPIPAVKQVREYRILRSFYVNRLEEQVCDHLKEGWQPVGGPYATLAKDAGSTSMAHMHYQAVAR